MKEERNNQILYYFLVRNKSQADIGRMFDGISRQRIWEITHTYMKRFLLSDKETLNLQSTTGKLHQFNRQHIFNHLSQTNASYTP